MPIDIFDTERPAPDRVFRYPLYERWLWLMVLVVAILALVFLRHIREFIETEGPRALAVLAVVVLFLFITVWISLRAWISKVIISPVSLKARVFGQGVQRISWIHIQRVAYKWRPLGHKLIFIGSDGARVSFRSCIRGYTQLISFIRDNAPQPVLDQLEELIGEEEEPEEEAGKVAKPKAAATPEGVGMAEPAEPSVAEPPPPELPELPVEAPEASVEEPRDEATCEGQAVEEAPGQVAGAQEPSPAPGLDAARVAQEDREEEEEGDAEGAAEKGKRKWWWVFLGK